jgi:pyruvate/2-oxoglutarate dehydrogenase complex dihydrolipoamide dehydrogenase (E3) component
MRTKEIVVIGAGPAGCAAAIEAARAGCAVSLVAEEPVGGRATHASLVPSKVFLHAVAIARARAEGPIPEAAAISAEIERVVELRAQQLRSTLDDAGIRLVRGVARFVGPDVIEIARAERAPERVPFDAAVIASGSVPFFPEGFFGSAPGPDGARILAPRHLRSMRDLPRTMLVIGGGATGAEMVHALASLGVEITWLLDEYGILPGFDRELADSLGDVIMERGTKIVHGKRVLRVGADGAGVIAALDGGRTYSAERAMIAIGRRADTGRLGLTDLGLALDPATGALDTDTQCRTAIPTILAAGDAAGRPFIASKAAIEGWAAGRNAAGGSAPELAARGYVETVYTDPEIAIVGLTPARAAAAKRAIDVRTIGFGESLKGTLADVGRDPHARGVLRVVVDPDSRVVLGASAIGPHAAEALGPIAVALRASMTLDDLGAAGLASPTFGELAAIAAR